MQIIKHCHPFVLTRPVSVPRGHSRSSNARFVRCQNHKSTMYTKIMTSLWQKYIDIRITLDLLMLWCEYNARVVAIMYNHAVLDKLWSAAIRAHCERRWWQHSSGMKMSLSLVPLLRHNLSTAIQIVLKFCQSWNQVRLGCYRERQLTLLLMRRWYTYVIWH